MICQECGQRINTSLAGEATRHICPRDAINNALVRRGFIKEDPFVAFVNEYSHPRTLAFVEVVLDGGQVKSIAHLPGDCLEGSVTFRDVEKYLEYLTTQPENRGHDDKPRTS